MALQSSGTNGPEARRLARWIARASSSLPVPELPVMSTVAVLAATSRATRSRSAMTLLRKTIGKGAPEPSESASWNARCSRRRAAALPTTSSRSSMSKGFAR